MLKTKNILIAVIVIVVIGIGLYFVLTSPPSEAPETETPAEGVLPEIEYEIVSMSFSQEEGIKRAAYDVVTGELEEEQAKTLAGKIIGDIATEDPSIKEIALLFYSDAGSAAAGRCDVAHVNWILNEISVRMIEK